MGFADMAKLLYANIEVIQILEWTETEQRALNALKKPHESSSDILKPFHMFMDESKCIALDVIT